MSTTLTISEAEGKLAQLLELVQAGHEVIIQDAHQGQAKLVAMPAQVNKPRVLGLHEGSWWVADDFDAPLPDSFWLGKDADEPAA